MENMTVKTPVDIQMQKFNVKTAIHTFKFHAVRNAEALNLCQSATGKSAYEASVKSALFDNPACGLVPAKFLNALACAFGDFMVVDAVTDVCDRLTLDGKTIKFN
ncbi:hypothetical protein AAM37_gp50 [Pantoea phage vB_PagM_AAM37]|uniref:Uncharacterized protein n=1 Tax=Pantoea phage vB_PagM_AAM37 TaxID=2588093 RepID=A0A513ZYH4_9CAUD|nr:hypothetical protein HWC22_gp50 [Pantoea phage vB_PagM_AAM37]QDH45721.1 hypothetical protein AAM37_gp50 [Pantoea phage vB_PagM_AAM37]